MCVLIWNSFKIFTVSLTAEEIANGNLKLILSKFSALPLKPFRFSRQILIYSPTILHDRHLTVRGWHMSCEWEKPGARSSEILGRTVFHYRYKYPCLLLTSLLLRSTSLSRSSFPNPSAAATSSSPVRKSFTASTSSPSYSRRLWISSLRRRRSRLPLPS